MADNIQTYQVDAPVDFYPPDVPGKSQGGPYLPPEVFTQRPAESYARPQIDQRTPGATIGPYIPPEALREQQTRKSNNPFLEGLARGGLESAGAISGGFAAFKLGGMTGNPAVALASGLVGVGVGSMAGTGASELVGARSPDEIPGFQRPAAKAGYSLGGGFAIGAGPYAASRIGLKVLDRGLGMWLNTVVQRAGKSPYVYGGIEASGIVGSSAGAYAAEALAPGNEWAALTGEVMGGAVLNPVQRAVDVTNIANWAFNKASKSIGKNAQERKLADRLAVLFKEHEKDPELLIKVLAADNPYGLTAAQLTGDPLFISLEREFSKRSEAFKQSGPDKAYKARELMTAQINVLKQDGSPDSLKAIAEIRVARFTSLLDEEIKKGLAESVAAVKKVSKGLQPKDIGEVSSAAYEPLHAVNLRAKDKANELYDLVDPEVKMSMVNLKAAVEVLLRETAPRLRDEKVPKWILDSIADAEKGGGKKMTVNSNTLELEMVPTGDAPTDYRVMNDLRKKLSSIVRGAGRDTERLDEARRAHILEEAILEDMHVAMRDLGDDSYDNARAFYSAYKKSFQDTFVGRVYGKTKTNPIPMDPTIMLTRAFAGGVDQVNIKLHDLEEATRLFPTVGFGEDGAVELMLDAQESMFRILMTKSIGPDGRFSVDAMTETMKNHGVLFERHPFDKVKKDMLEMVKTEQGMRRIEDFVKARNSDIGKKSAMARIVGTDAVAVASKILLSTGNQEDELVRFINLAKKGGTGKNGVVTITPEEGISSARASVLNAAFNRSISNDRLNLDKFRELLFTPNVGGKKSVMEILRGQGVISFDHDKNLRKMFNVLDNIKAWERQGAALDISEGVSEMALVLGAKIGASKLASAVQKASGSSGSSIIVHGAVAKAAEQVVSKIPAAKLNDLAILFFNDPKMLADLLRKEFPPEGKMAQIRRFHAWAIQSGLTLTRELMPDPSNNADQEPEMFSQ